MHVDSAVWTSGVGLPQLPTGHGKALDAHGFRDLLLREASCEAQLRAHSRRRQDVVHEGVDPLQAVRVCHGAAFQDR
ncbi:hypothetical protein PYK79_29615 [Streptomyces sp. ID05-04B]|nr:hypothetical protein [Streptomyces sp. ID05-04B]